MGEYFIPTEEQRADLFLCGERIPNETILEPNGEAVVLELVLLNKKKFVIKESREVWFENRRCKTESDVGIREEIYCDPMPIL